MFNTKHNPVYASKSDSFANTSDFDKSLLAVSPDKCFGAGMAEKTLGPALEQTLPQGDHSSLMPNSPDAKNNKRGEVAANDVELTSGRVFAAGDMVGHYRILGRLGAGGMGDVYYALDTRLERHVAIKVALESILNDDAMLREGRLVAALNHPHVVTVYEVGVHAQRAFLVMELLRGETLRARMNAAIPSIDVALAWASDILRGLSAAHGANVMHLDLKPENVFITSDGTLKLLDFGIARRKQSGIIAQETIVGTVAYMAPEQLLGLGTDFRADLFSFGILLHELVTGTHPFMCEDARATMLALVRGDYFSNGTASDPAIHAIIAACMQRDPNARPQSAAHVLGELERLRQTRSAGPLLGHVAQQETAQGHIAYQCVSQAKDVDILVVPGLFSRFDAWSREREGAAFLRTLAHEGRVILFDRAGLGASDRLVDSALPFLEDEIAHIDAILEATHARQIIIVALEMGAPLALLYAALRPSRVAGLAVYAGAATYSDPETKTRLAARADAWGTAANVTLCAPSVSLDNRLSRWVVSWEHAVGSSKAIKAWLNRLGRVDVTPILEFIAAPTLVLHRQGDRFQTLAQSAALAKKITDAQFIVLPGDDHWPCMGSPQLANEIVRHVRSCGPNAIPARSLATWICTDIPTTSLPETLGPFVAIQQGAHSLLRVDRPGHALRIIRGFLSKRDEGKVAMVCFPVGTQLEFVAEEAEKLLLETPPKRILGSPLASSIVEGTAGLSLQTDARPSIPPGHGLAKPTLTEVAPLSHKSFSIQCEDGVRLRIDGSIMVKDPQRQLVPHFRRIHECAVGCDKLVLDLRHLTQINSSGLGLFIGWVGWIQAEPPTSRYQLEIHIDPKVLWQRVNLMPLAMIAPDIIEVVEEA